IDNMDHNLGAWKSGPLGPYPRPYSRHTYDKLQVVGDEFIMLMTGTLRGGCAPSDFELFKTETFAHYNLNDAQWSFSEKSSRESPLTFGYDFPGTDVDPVSGNVIAVGRGGIWIYDIHSKKVTHVVSLNI